MNRNIVTCDGINEILASKDFDAIPIKVALPESGSIVPAGTPLTAVGASTTGANAVGILLYDVDVSENPNASIIIRGIINSVKAQEHCGITYANALYAALPMVRFRTNIGTNTEDTNDNTVGSAIVDIARAG